MMKHSFLREIWGGGFVKSHPSLGKLIAFKRGRVCFQICAPKRLSVLQWVFPHPLTGLRVFKKKKVQYVGRGKRYMG